MKNGISGIKSKQISEKKKIFCHLLIDKSGNPKQHSWLVYAIYIHHKRLKKDILFDSHEFLKDCLHFSDMELNFFINISLFPKDSDIITDFYNIKFVII